MVEVVPAVTGAELEQVRALFREYHRIPGLSECVVGFEQEMAGLPGKYTALLLARVGGEAMGVVALRPFDAASAEMKRLYVRPAARGTGLGRRLAEALAAEARAQGFTLLRLDTLPFMKEAIALYRRLGYRETARYYDAAPPAALFFQLALRTKMDS